jgi:hypothetical protein
MIPGAKRSAPAFRDHAGKSKTATAVTFWPRTRPASRCASILAEVVTEYKSASPNMPKTPCLSRLRRLWSNRILRETKARARHRTRSLRRRSSRMPPNGRGASNSEDSGTPSACITAVRFGAVPWVYRDNLTFAEFSRIAEHNLGLPGVTVAERASRVYPLKGRWPATFSAMCACRMISAPPPKTAKAGTTMCRTNSAGWAWKRVSTITCGASPAYASCSATSADACRRGG